MFLIQLSLLMEFANYTHHEGYVTPFPWREEFQFHLDSISTTLQVVSRKETRGTMRVNLIDMSSIFLNHMEDGDNQEPC